MLRGAPRPRRAERSGGLALTSRHPGARDSDAQRELARRALAELLGTAFLVAGIVGSGIAAQRLSPHDVGLELLENTAATASVLVAVILAVGPVSGAHLNPVITMVDGYFGGLSPRAIAVYLGAQFTGGALGAVTANTMFGLDPVSLSAHHRASGPHLLAEAVATFGLVIVVFGVTRSGRATAAAFAVGAYIAGAYWFTSSTSFANPAVTLGRMMSDTFSGVAPGSVPGFVALEIVGGAVGALCVAVLYPDVRRRAERVVVPHEGAA